MKKTFISCAAMALALLACSDDSSSTAPDLSAVASSPSVQSSSSVVPASSAVLVSSAKVESSSSAVPVSSAKVESSSSVAVAKSSSSVKAPVSSSAVVAEPSHLKITDAVAQCGSRGTEDPLLDGSSSEASILPKDIDYVLPPTAGRHISKEHTGFYIENVTLTCGATIDTLDVYVSGDTVYVNAKLDYTNAQRCLCPSKVDFAVDNDEAYYRARWLVFDDGSSRNLHNTMEIYDIHVTTVEEVETRVAKNVNIECKSDENKLENPIKLDNASFVVGVIADTNSTKQPVATKTVGDDGYVTIVIDNLSLGCGIDNAEFDVFPADNVLRVKPKNSASLYATNCICLSRVSFKVDNTAKISATNTLIFDQFDEIPLVDATNK